MKVTKNMRDREGSTGLAIIAILVVILIVMAVLVLSAGGGGSGGGGGGGSGDDGGGSIWDDLTGNKEGKLISNPVCTMYVQDLGSGKVYTAPVSLTDASWTEAMMLSFGQGVRSVELKPAQSWVGDGGGGTSNTGTSTEPLYKDSSYAIWGVVDYKVTGENMKSIDSMAVEFYGRAGAVSSSSTPDHAEGTDNLYCSCGTSKVTVTNTQLTSGSEYQASSSDKKFDRAYTNGAPVTLTGDRVDGSVLTVYLTMKGTDDSGKAVTYTALATMKFTISSYVASSSGSSSSSTSGSGSSSPTPVGTIHVEITYIGGGYVAV